MALLLGPLYHLTEESDRVGALREALRVTRPDGLLVAACISRFASTYDGLALRYLDDPDFERIVESRLGLRTASQSHTPKWVVHDRLPSST